MNTRKGIVGVVYIYTSTNQYQGGFDALVKSLTVK
jgi:hypothetical protein